MRFRWLCLTLNVVLVFGLWVNQPVFASHLPKVVVSIAPFHALVSAVMEGIGEPKLLLKGNSSPHDYSLRPSEIKILEEADIIFWGGPELESFLITPLKIAPPSSLIVEFGKTRHLALLRTRRSASFEPHTHNHLHHHTHEWGSYDMHFWLDPNNAKILVGSIAQYLAAKDPHHQKQYFENAKKFNLKIKTLDDKIKQKLQAVQHRSFIVFHDAYQYFERHYGLAGVGAISLHPEIPPSVERLKAIHNTVKKAKAVCIFSEPQFKSTIIRSIANDTGINVGQLDPIGYPSNQPGEGYLNLLNDLSENISGCLRTKEQG